MPFPLAIPLISMGVSALGSWMSNRKKNQAEQKSQSTSMPTMSPEYMGLQNALLPNITKRLTSSSALPRGYEERGIGDVNRTYDLGKQSIDNNLTARGLGGSPIAGAAGTRLETGRLGTISDFQQTLPMIRRDFENQDMQTAMQMLALGRGNTTNSTSTASSGGGGWQSLLGSILQGVGPIVAAGAMKKPLPSMPGPISGYPSYPAPVPMNRP